MDKALNPKDKVLLMRDEGEGNQLKLVKGINKRGKIDAIDPMKANPNDFLLIDRHADPIENFFKNFMSQAKNPSHTGFFAVSIEMLNKVLTLDDKELEKHRINPQDFLTKQQKQAEKTEKTEEQVLTDKKESDMAPTKQSNDFKQFDTSRIPESEYQKYGITPDDLQHELRAMSYGYKSPHLIEIQPKIGDETFPVKARLSLEEQADGSLKFVSYPYQQQVDLDKPFQGIMLPDDVKENLLKTGNGGRPLELEPTPGNKAPSLVSIDKLTNRLEAVPLDRIQISEKLKGVELSPEQQQEIKEGRKVLIEGMTTKNTMGTDNPKLFDAYIQFNAARGSYDFSYDGLDRNKYSQDNKQEQVQSAEQKNKVRIPKKLLGVDLDEKQQNMLRDNKTIYVQGMVKDGQDQPFNAYIRINNEKGKLDFFKWNPDKAQKQGAQVKPAEESKTQVAVNSRGKTNEATKHSKAPLKQGQQNTTGNQAKPQKRITGKRVNKSAEQSM